MARLRLTSSPWTEEYELSEITVIGRDRACAIVVKDSRIAGAQARISALPDGRYEIEQLGLDFPTLVNDQPVTRADLTEGDSIKIGATEFEFVDDRLENRQTDKVIVDDIQAVVSMRQDASRELSFDEPSGEIDLTELRSEYETLRAAYELARAIGLETDIDKLLDRMLEIAFTRFSAERSAILLWDRQQQQWSLTKVRTLDPSEKLHLSRSLLKEVIETRDAVVSVDMASDDRFDDSDSAVVSGIRSALCVPMIDGDEVVGIIYLDSPRATKIFEDRDLQLLSTFARHAALVIKNAALRADLARANAELTKAKEAVEQTNRVLQEKNQELEKLVVRDPLTKLYNHAYLRESVQQEILRSQRNNLQFSLLLLDVDNFRQVNEMFGHQVGDQMLRLFGDLLQNQARRSDVGFRLEERDVTIRYGGDTFAVLLPETAKRGAAAKAERLRAAVQGFDFFKYNLPRVTVSIGVTGFPDDGQEQAKLLGAAEAALLAAQQAGANQTVSYSPGLRQISDRKPDEPEPEVGQRVALEKVIRNYAMRYVYQPIVSAETRQIFAYEALCRPAEGTFKSPVELLHAAEGAGKILELGKAMRELSIRPVDQLKKPRLLFINLHPLELNLELLEWARGCPWASRIVLEVTESAAIEEYERVHDLLTHLKRFGFRIAIDDLGSGYSGLNSLGQLGPDFVKLDMRLIRDIGTDSRSARLIKYILDFANGEGMQVVGEGVETADEVKVVTDLGCHLLQGYFFSRPQPPFCELSSQ
ncbi:MAG: EAL domain-containing protein [Deltaproteobacteria bacterium]|nr:EAL domain-containing protein [Deltaproteobacteria bacterium]